jgi:serine/threonine protein phosphatase 1
MRKMIRWLTLRASPQLGEQRRRRLDLGSEPLPYPLYAIGDVHGCLDLLKRAEAVIADDMSRLGRPGLVVLLGDYVDRGPASAQVLEHLSSPSALGLKRVTLCGNHDDLFLRFLERPEAYMHWLEMGGDKTLASYGVDLQHLSLRRKGSGASLMHVLQEAVPETHRSFLMDLPVSLKAGQVLFVHAGVAPAIPIEEQRDEDMMWIRGAFLKQGPELPHLIVVHGHTPQEDPDYGIGRIGIDTGAVYSGKLTVLRIDGEEISILQ